MMAAQDVESHIQSREPASSVRSDAAATLPLSKKSEAGFLEADIDFPEGGWQAYLVVAGAWCCSFMTFGQCAAASSRA